jgi:hypothetical protein
MGHIPTSPLYSPLGKLLKGELRGQSILGAKHNKGPVPLSTCLEVSAARTAATLSFVPELVRVFRLEGGILSLLLVPF